MLSKWFQILLLVSVVYYIHLSLFLYFIKVKSGFSPWDINYFYGISRSLFHWRQIRLILFYFFAVDFEVVLGVTFLHFPSRFGCIWWNISVFKVVAAEMTAHLFSRFDLFLIIIICLLYLLSRSRYQPTSNRMTIFEPFAVLL